MEKNAVVLGDGTDADVVALAEDALEAARPGVPRPRRAASVASAASSSRRSRTSSTGELVEQLLAAAVRRRVGRGGPARGARAGAARRRRRRRGVARRGCGAPGSTCGCRSAGDKRALMETVARNALQSLALHKTQRAGDLTARSRALEELQEALDLPEAPLRIECFDVSNLQGTDVVASHGGVRGRAAAQVEYRRFAMRGAAAPTAPATTTSGRIAEVVTRRFRRLLDERPEADPATPPTIASPGIDPDDRPAPQVRLPAATCSSSTAGAPQVAAAAARARASWASTTSRSCGLAKRLEEVWLPGDPDPVILPRHQRGALPAAAGARRGPPVRDHLPPAARGRSAMVEPCWTTYPGLGEARRKALLRQFGSLKRLRAATAEEIAEVPGIGPRTAEAVVAALAGATPAGTRRQHRDR